MNLLTSGVDISTIAIWLGHSSIETTHKYMVADMEAKRKAMEKAGDAGDCSYIRDWLNLISGCQPALSQTAIMESNSVLVRKSIVGCLCFCAGNISARLVTALYSGSISET